MLNKTNNSQYKGIQALCSNMEEYKKGMGGGWEGEGGVGLNVKKTTKHNKSMGSLYLQICLLWKIYQ